MSVRDLISDIRKEFPRADSDASGRRRVFFDAGAGSLVLGRAAQAVEESMVDYSANLGLPAWESQKSMELIQESRKAIKDFLNAESENCIASGDSVTSIFFRLSYALAKVLDADANVVSTEYEHYGHLTSWLELARRGSIKEVRLTRFNPQTGELDLDHFAQLVDSKTKVVSVTGIANTLGTVSPLEKMGKYAREVGALFVVDAAHMTPHIRIDLQKLDCDLLIFSGYKIFSKRGGFMYGKRTILEKLQPYRPEPAPDVIPGKWEIGTLDQTSYAAFRALLEYLEWLGGKVLSEFEAELGDYTGRVKNLKSAMLWTEHYETELSKAMLYGGDGAPGLTQMPKLTLYGSKDISRSKHRCPTFMFNILGVDARKVAEYLWERHSIAVPAGNFYSRALKTYGIESAVRASLAHYNTVQEISSFLRALDDACRKLV